MPEQRTGQRLILADRTVIEDGTAGLANGFLWCWFSGMTLPEAAALFLDPAKTNLITFEYGEMVDSYEGYTNCTNLSAGADGQISVCMTKEVTINA